MPDLPPPSAAALQAWTVDQAAEALQVTRKTIYALIARGTLRRYKVGSRTRLNRADVLALIGGRHDA